MTATPPPTSTTHPRATLAATILGSSLAFIDGSVVNVALPALARDLNAAAANLSWAINAYLLPLGALILLGGALGDHFGRRRLFLIGLGVFTLGSVLCAGAPVLAWFLNARALQGLGAALLMPNSLAILGTAFAGEARGRAIGTWAAAGALAGALGPIIGGWLVDTLGWRSIFLLNVPIAAGAAYFALRYVADADADADAGDGGRPVPLDAAGAVLATAGLGSLTWALTAAAGANGPTTVLWGAAVGGAALLCLFVAHEKNRGAAAMMPLALFATPAFVGLTLLTFFLYGSLGGLVVMLPFFLIRIEHWSAVAAGAALLPVPVLIGLGSRFMGRVASRHGARLPLAGGAALVGLGLVCYARGGAGPVRYWLDIFPPTLIVALGMGACVAPLTTSVMTSVEARHVGIASGFNSAVARIAGLIATALLGFVFVKQGSADAFVAGCRVAAVIGGASAAIAALCAAWFLRSRVGQMNFRGE